MNEATDSSHAACILHQRVMVVAVDDAQSDVGAMCLPPTYDSVLEPIG